MAALIVLSAMHIRRMAKEQSVLEIEVSENSILVQLLKERAAGTTLCAVTSRSEMHMYVRADSRHVRAYNLYRILAASFQCTYSSLAFECLTTLSNRRQSSSGELLVQFDYIGAERKIIEYTGSSNMMAVSVKSD